MSKGDIETQQLVASSPCAMDFGEVGSREAGDTWLGRLCRAWLVGGWSKLSSLDRDLKSPVSLVHFKAYPWS